MKKLIVLLCAAIALLCCLTACGESSGQSSEKVIEFADMKALADKMIAADTGFPEMLVVTDADESAEDLFASVSEMDYNKIAHYLIAYSSEGKADEIVVIAVKDKNDVSEAKASLTSHVNTRKNMYRTYDPSQEPRAAAAKVYVSGYYAVLIISDRADAVQAAFDGGSAAE